MSKFPDPPQPSHLPLKEAPAQDLEFPVAPDFLSLPPRLDPRVMLLRLEETMPWRSTRPGEQERRALTSVQVEFIL